MGDPRAAAPGGGVQAPPPPPIPAAPALSPPELPNLAGAAQPAVTRGGDGGGRGAQRGERPPDLLRRGARPGAAEGLVGAADPPTAAFRRLPGPPREGREGAGVGVSWETQRLAGGATVPTWPWWGRAEHQHRPP